VRTAPRIRGSRNREVTVTLIWSTLLAIVAYFVKNEVMDPLRAFRGVRWRTATVLVVHENILANPEVAKPEDLGEAKGDVRRQAAEIQAAYRQIPLRGALAACRFVLAPEAVDRAVSNLIGLSNSNKGSENSDRIASIRAGLKLTTRPRQRRSRALGPQELRRDQIR
jgi:hypothetical protein